MKWPYTLGIIAALGLGLYGGWHYHIYYSSKLPVRLTEVRENTSKYQLVNPLLLTTTFRKAPEYAALTQKLNTYIDTSRDHGDSTSISVYLKDLNTAHWTGINEDKLYDPSSMLKVAVMIGYLKEAETDPTILQKKLVYKAYVDPGQHYKPQNPLKDGNYSIEELIKAMIIDSDNVALNALYDNNREPFVNVLKTLQIPPPATINTTDFMSAADYSKIFRTLYNATYLSPEVSEQVIKLLTTTTFDKGITTGVPKDMLVAHKFGEHTSAFAGVSTSNQLHDCGMVYYPGHPYFLCIMTRGNNFSKLEKVVSDISKITYDAIVSIPFE